MSGTASPAITLYSLRPIGRPPLLLCAGTGIRQTEYPPDAPFYIGELLRTPERRTSEFAGALSSEARSALDQKLSGAGREAGAHEVERPLLLDLRCQLLFAHLAAPGRAVGPDELLLLVEALDQPTPPLLSGKFFGGAHGQLPLCGLVSPTMPTGHYAA